MAEKIGRFNLIRELGRGTQGVVHLAIDPVLQRNVAIKTLHLNAEHDFNTKDLLLKEARTIGKMVHPNIVSIYEAGEDDQQQPYLVFEYVSGELLSEQMKKSGAMTVKQALELIKPVLEAMSEAARKNIIHCDLKPANILINDENVPKVMDFGIARIMSEQKTRSNGFFGTPRYMPPEYIKEQLITASNDSYALGIIFYEMLTGKSAYKGTNIRQIIQSVLKDKLAPPSKLNNDIDAAFESILLKAIDKKPDNRYQSAIEFNAAIDEYIERNTSKVTGSSKKMDATIEFLLRRMKRKKDFPALSESLFKINTIIDQDDKGFDELANAIVEDFSLTNKILKIVNSAYYRRSGGEVKTISHAVMLLGFDAIRSIAVSLILIDHLHDKSQAKRLRDQVVSCLYSGVFAKNLAEKSQLKNREEVFLSGIFHNLGKLLSIFYFNEEYLEIEALVNNENLSDEEASTKVLGVSYNQLGNAIARVWELPHYIVNTIMPYDTKTNSRRLQLSQEEKMHAISSLSNELTQLIEKEDDGQWRQRAVKLWREYTPQLNLKDRDLTGLADQAKEDLVDLNSILNINMSKSAIIQGLENETQVQSAVELAAETDIEKTIVIEPAEKTADHQVQPDVRLSVEDILNNGINNISALLSTDYSVTNIFKLCLDVMSEAFEFDHSIMCMVNTRQKIMEGKFAHGLNNAFLSQFRFTLKYKPDVFHLALEKGMDIFIADSTDPKIIRKIPPWYQQIVEAETFIVLPVMLKNKPIGLFYGDRFKTGELNMKPGQLKLVQKLKYLASEALVKKFQT